MPALNIKFFHWKTKAKNCEVTKSMQLPWINRTPKQILVFLRQTHEGLVVVKRVERTGLSNEIKLNNHTYLIKVDTPTYLSQLDKIYHFDYDSGSQYSFKEMKALISPEDLDSIVSGKIIKELTSGVMDNQREKLMLLLAGAIMGALIAGLGLVMYYSDQIQQLTQELYQTGGLIPVKMLRILLGGNKI